MLLWGPLLFGSRTAFTLLLSSFQERTILTLTHRKGSSRFSSEKGGQNYCQLVSVAFSRKESVTRGVRKCLPYVKINKQINLKNRSETCIEKLLVLEYYILFLKICNFFICTRLDSGICPQSPRRC